MSARAQVMFEDPRLEATTTGRPAAGEGTIADG